MTGIRPENISNKIADIANALDKKDGQEDGKINASIWNEFVKDKGGKEIKYSISLENAKKSISTYLNRKAGEAKQDLATNWLNNVNKNETETKAAATQNGTRTQGNSNSATTDVSTKADAPVQNSKKPKPEATKTNTAPASYKGALNEYNTAKTDAEKLKKDLENAITGNTLEDFARGDNSWNKDIEDYNIKAISILLSEDSDNVKLLLGDMSNSRKVKLMKELNPQFKGSKVSDEELITAAKTYSKTLENRAKAEEAEINKQNEALRQTNIKNLGKSFEVKANAVANTKKRELENAKNKANELEKAVKEAIDKDDLENFATGDYLVSDDIDDFDKDAKAYYLAGDSNNAKLLVADMPNSRKIKLMKEFNPQYTGTTVSDEELIAAAKKHKKGLIDAVTKETSKITNLVGNYNTQVKTIAEMQYADATKLKKSETRDRKTVTVTYGDKVITVKYAPNSKTDIEEIKIGNLTIKTGSTLTVSQNNDKIDIGFKNIEQIVRQIIQKAKA